MRVLVACEYSGVVSQAFRDKGHNAISCDILENEQTGRQFHYLGDVRDILDRGWDLMIAHPPCTYLTVSGNRWYHDKPELIQSAYKFVMQLWEAPIEKICIENPVGRISTLWRKPDQYIQPYQFGHPEPKKTGLWLKNLPALVPTKEVEPEEYHVTKSGKRIPKWYSNNKKLRDRTFQGIADAMAEQWG